jgi:predicted AlkP superfamily pyrophosphatase or phosphodiesterase
MRAGKFIGFTLIGSLGMCGGGFAYTARAPYSLPEQHAVASPREFVASTPRRADDRTVVLFVFDGFAPATVRAASLPNLARMAKEGAHTLDMRPVFPSLSMPNHFSISTGCEPSHHGVVSNRFKDSARGLYSDVGDADWLLGCEPIHVVAERQGVRAAVFASVAAISSTRGKLASVVEPYMKPPRDARAQADRIIAQLERKAGERPGLITAYVNEPDQTSHRFGPTGKETLAVARELDAQIGRVLAAIERLGLRDRVTLAVTTDHGMLPVDTIVSVERLLRIAGLDGLVLADGTVANVYLADRAEKATARAALAKHPFVDVIDPAAPPPYARFGRGERVGDLVVSMHRGYYTFDTGQWPALLRFGSFIGPGYSASTRFGGMHGYDPETVPEVRSIFYAWGAQVPAGVEPAGMRAIDVHPTVARWLGIQPGAPLDGHAHDALVAAAEAGQPP